MKERPILFSAPMVRALLEGRKTMTRRVCKKDARGADSVEFVTTTRLTPDKGDGERYTGWVAKVDALGNLRLPLICPYGAIGDRLWVRETWGNDCSLGLSKVDCREAKHKSCVGYRATIRIGHETDDWVESSWAGHWHSSIHMPRWASRITLEITGVMVERLQDIGEADARCEGVEARDGFARAAFVSLWQSINGKDSWAANPWVWAISFRKVEGGK